MLKNLFFLTLLLASFVAYVFSGRFVFQTADLPDDLILVMTITVAFLAIGAFILFTLKRSFLIAPFLIVVPIPFCIMLSVSYLFGGLALISEDPFSLMTVSAVSFAPLTIAALAIGMGFVFSGTPSGIGLLNRNVEASLSNPLVIFCFISAGLIYIALLVLNIPFHGGVLVWDHFIPWILAVLSLSFFLARPDKNSGFRFLNVATFGSSVLIVTFVFTAVALVKYLLVLGISFKSSPPDLSPLGWQTGEGWLSFFWAGLYISASHTTALVCGHVDLESMVKRNWHFIELYGFFILLTVAPPTAIDLLS